jgi:YHS domain-containing protein
MPRNQTPALQKQATAQSGQSADVFTLRKGTQAPSPRNFAEPADGFFPEDSQRLPIISSAEPSAAMAAVEDVDMFFPDDAQVPAADAPPVDIADNSMKARMNELLNSRSQASEEFATPVEESAAPFEMPGEMPKLAAQQEIEPPAVPAAVTEVVTTSSAPFETTVNLAEPAPFFTEGERAIDPKEDMDIAAITGQTFDPSGADSEQTAGTVSDANEGGSRMQQIAAREGTGLKGFCPVALRDDRELKDGRVGIVAFYQSKPYYFSSVAAKEAFEAAPQQYAPAANGEDVTMKTLTGEVVEGSLDHCVWYKDRLYLFQSAENLATFMAAPSAMAVAD